MVDPAPDGESVGVLDEEWSSCAGVVAVDAVVTVEPSGLGCSSLLCLSGVTCPLDTVGDTAEGGADVRPGGIGMTGVAVPLAIPVATCTRRICSEDVSVSDEGALV